MANIGIPAHMQHLFAGEDAGPFGLYPENDSPVGLFMSVMDQWRYAPAGMGGLILTGLDYTLPLERLNVLGLSAEDRREHLDCLSILAATYMLEANRSNAPKGRA
jgi:hypothetical protein